jgi:hypothetical protein
LMQPSARCDTIRHVSELVRAIDFDEVLEDGRLDQIRVKLSDAVDFVGANNCQVSHTDHLRARLFNNGDTGQYVAVLWEVALDVLQEVQVDVVDDLKVTGKEVLHEWNRPLLKSLRKDCVVRIAESLLDDAPGLVPLQTLKVDQDAQQFRDRKRWVSVVKLNGDLVGEVLPGALGLLESANNVVERGSTPKVLLLQAKLLSTFKAVKM